MTCRKFGCRCDGAATLPPSPRATFRIQPIFLTLLAAVFFAASATAASADGLGGKSADGKCPPETRKDDVVDTLHGVKIADPYRWLEDQNSPETRAWIEAEDACTDAVLKAVPGRAKLTERLTQLMKVDAVQPPRRTQWSLCICEARGGPGSLRALRAAWPRGKR